MQASGGRYLLTDIFGSQKFNFWPQQWGPSTVQKLRELCRADTLLTDP